MSDEENKNVQENEISEKPPIPAKPALKRVKVKLDAKECGTNRLGTVDTIIEFIDYTQKEPYIIEYEATIRMVAATKKEALLQNCIIKDEKGVTDIDWDKYTDLLTGFAFGFGIDDMMSFKESHPFGLWGRMTTIAVEVNGGGDNLSDVEMQALKNMVGQE